MKRKLLIGLLLAVLLLVGCAGEKQTTPAITQVTETSTAEADREVRPGIYMSNDLTDFPFPTSGYDVYIVGERMEIRRPSSSFKFISDPYIKRQACGMWCLEEHQAYESDANAYVLGRTDNVLPGELCLRADILGLIREFNESLSPDEKVTVHLVEVDSPLSVVYKHLFGSA